MNDKQTIDRREFLQLYRRLYSFLRQSMEQEKLLRLKEMVRSSLQSAASGEEDAFNSLILEMRTALITINEIGLRQPTVCAVLLYRAAVAEQYQLEDMGGSASTVVSVTGSHRGLKPHNPVTTLLSAGLSFVFHVSSLKSVQLQREYRTSRSLIHRPNQPSS